MVMYFMLMCVYEHSYNILLILLKDNILLLKDYLESYDKKDFA